MAPAPTLTANTSSAVAEAENAAPHRNGIAQVYVIETLGALVAGVLATVALIPLMHWWFSLTLVLVPLGLVWRAPVLRVILTAALLGAAYWSPTLDAWAQCCATRFLTGTIVCDLDTPRERLIVTQRGGECAFFSNGRLLGSSVQRELAEELAWYARVCAAQPRSALLVGFSYNGLLREVVQAGMRATVPDAQAAWLPRLAPFLLPEDRAMLTNAAVQIITHDPREYLARHTRTGQFDVIVQTMGTPESYTGARLYSAEWFALLARQITPRGALLVALPGSAGYVPDDLARLLARTRLSMQAGLQRAGCATPVEVIPGSATLLVARNGATAPLSDMALAARVTALRAATTMVPPRWFGAALLHDHLSAFRRTAFEDALDAAQVQRDSTDARPAVYGDALVYAEARFGSALHRALTWLYYGARDWWVWLGCGAVAGLCSLSAWACGWRRSGLRLALMAAVSLTGFMTEMTVLVRFTTVYGAAFYAVGLLFAGYMAGLACGAAAMQQFGQHLPRRGVTLLLAVVLCAASAAAIAPLPAHVIGMLTVCACIIVPAAAASGAMFAWLAQQHAPAHEARIGVYAADVLGAVAGAVLFSCVLPPTCGFLAGAVLCAVCVAVAASLSLTLAK
jgi:predicted membrane-bound spermidine synthase